VGNSVTPCQGAGDKKEETKGVEPSPSILTDRGGNHLDTLTHDTHNPMTLNQDFSPETPQGINILDPSPVTPHGKILLDFSPETPQEIIPGVTSQGASGETSQKVSTETSKNR
jgi:hypothetical protein